MATKEVHELQKKLGCIPRLLIFFSKIVRNNVFTDNNKKNRLGQFNIPFNIHNYVSYPSIVNMVYFTTVCLMVHNHTCNAKIQT